MQETWDYLHHPKYALAPLKVRTISSNVLACIYDQSSRPHKVCKSRPTPREMASGAQCFPPAFSTCFRWMSSALFLLLLLLAQVDAQNRRREVQTLAAFKATMETSENVRQIFYGSGGYWSSWDKADANACAWVGVTCTTNYRVEQLDLSGWGLSQLSSVAVLSNLTHLRQLDFSSNFLGPSIPDDIQTLTQLTHLDLSRNNFSGPIPPNITACQSLRYIYLEHNQLSNEVPDLRDLISLQVLHLQCNQLSGPFPKGLADLRSPVSVDLYENLFSGTIPSLSNLTKLLYLNLDNNNFTEFEGPSFPGTRSLEHLLVSNNQLQGKIPSGITNLSNLEVLNMSRNQLSDQIPDGLMNNGFQLDLSQNRLSGPIPSDLLEATKAMVSMNLSHNLLSDGIPFDAATQYNYSFLDFSHNNLTGSIPSDLFKSGNSYISSLWLQDNRLSGDIVDFLGNCSQYVQDLRLANNFLSGDLSLIANVRIAPDFEVLDLTNNSFTMTSTEAMVDPLRVLLESFMASDLLTEFRVGGNNFSGIYLPTYFSGLQSHSGTNQRLQVLDLSNNNLKGEISGAVFNSTWLPSLQVLNLSINDINGSLPTTIVTLSNLTTLNVTNNKLSGPLPVIPPNTILFNPSFFAGNPGLCGGPLPPCPPDLRTGLRWWMWLIIVGGSTFVAGTCLFATWRWRVYYKMHQQDADLIKNLLRRESTTLMSLRELKKATNNFAKSAQIGEGGFGIVYKGKLNDGTIVAIKKSKREGSDMDKDQFLNEVRILSQVNHRHLVKLLGCCMENKIALLVFEYVSNGTLQEHLQGKHGGVHLSWKQRLNIAIQTADAINYLHSAATFPIYHRDVKSTNILLKDDLSAKVADFGVSKLASFESTQPSSIAIQGTYGYIDPEYYSSLELTDKSDVYSFGVVLLELIAAKPVIDFGRGEDKTSLVNFAKPHIESEDLQQFIDPTLEKTYNGLTSNGKESILKMGRLAIKCLHVKPKERPSMNDVCIELQNLFLSFHKTSQHLSSLHSNDTQDPRLDHVVLLSGSSSGSSASIPSDSFRGSFIQMLQLSPNIRRRSQL